MALPKRQHVLDWITQAANIAMGRRVRHDQDAWKLGPIGFIEEDPEAFVTRLAYENSLTIRRNQTGSGLLPAIDQLGLNINPRVAAFYRHTCNYRFEVTCAWEPLFLSSGNLFARLFSHRIQQFNLPQADKGEMVTFKSDVIELLNAEGQIKYTIWLRKREFPSQVVFYGIYAACQFPTGEHGVKSVFPLPQGNTTVLFYIRGDEKGNLELDSSGKRYGDAGFYFFVKDWLGGMWKHYIPSLRQRIYVYEDEDQVLRADHTMTLWNRKLYSMNYKISEKIESEKEEKAI